MSIQVYNYDVVIVGGGTAGVAAAYALKNSGKRILLVEARERLGGTAVLSYVFDWIAGVHPPYIEDVFNSLKKQDYAFGDINNSWMPQYFLKDGLYSNSIQMIPFGLSEKYKTDLESEVDIWLNHFFVAAEMVNNKNIAQIRVLDKEKGEEKIISAAYFIDSSADAVLCRSNGAVLGVDYFYGRDKASLYDENLAADNPDPNELNEPSLMFFLSREGDDTECLNNVKTVYFDKKTNSIVKPSYITGDGYANLYPDDPEKKGRYYCNPMTGFGLTGMDVIKDGIDKSYLNAKSRMLEYWKFIKLNLILLHNSGKKDTDTWNGWIGWTVSKRILNIEDRYAPMLGIRETYRVACEYMLRQKDLSTLVSFDNLKDIIAIGTHTVDMHNRRGLDSGKINTFNNNDLRPYGIPYQCLIPKKYSNVLIACRAFGASQIAASSARTNKLVAQLGWAAGNAIKICIDKNKKLLDISGEELRSTQYINFQFYTNKIRNIIKSF